MAPGSNAVWAVGAVSVRRPRLAAQHEVARDLRPARR
jgi:hypothetical protein